MKARRCQGCAAPLPEAAAGESQRCRFCGLVHDAQTFGTDESHSIYSQTVASDRATGRLVRWIVVGAVVITLGTLVPVIGAMYAGWRVASSVMPGAITTLSSTLPTSGRTLDQLTDLPAGFHALDVAPPAGGYGALDAVAAVPWALTIAQAWAPDARLDRIDVARMRPDGTINAQDDAEASVTYRFRSPAKVAAHREQTRLSSSTESTVGLWVRVKGGKPEVYSDVARASIPRDEAPAPHPSAMPLPELARRPMVRTALADAPFFDGYMIHRPDEGWVWYFSTLANESRPRIRARDAAVWPYRAER